ncbi:MAG TPA: histidine kinase, partial [Rhodanobacteraceae bacterium]|nr:histidine kinase [Rhodanobacteraceae bacterium]
MGEEARQQRWRGLALAFGFWTLLALSFAVRMVVSAAAEGEALSWQRAFAWNLPNFYLWMLLTPLVGWLGRLTAGRGWPRFFALHVPAGAAIAFAQTTAMLAIYWPLRGPEAKPVSFGTLFQQEIVYSFHLALLTYWLMLVVLRGLESQRRLKDERLRASRLETQLVQAQLQALRTQLQPHFLFNTLNAISALALADPAQAKLMIARLSDFLRLTLEEHHSPQVPLSRELQLLECYLGIQRVRFQDRLVTRFDVADDAHNAAVPNLILQPLVENALRHGLLARNAGGALRISAARQGGTLRLQVDDDGLGLPDG